MPLSDVERQVAKEILKRKHAGTYTPLAKEDPNIPIYQKDPALYMRERLGLTLTEDQERICAAVSKYSKVLVKASHAIGKSYVSAGLALWFYECFNPGKVITSAPNAKQVATIIWGTMRTLTKDRKPKLPFAPKAPIMGDGPEHFALGITSKDANGFQGIHHENMLIIFDEAVGIRRDYWVAANHMVVGDTNKFLAICNPTDISSMAYEIDMKSGGNDWHVIEISSLNHPNIIASLNGLPEPFKGAASLRALMEDIRSDCEVVNKEDVTVYDFEFPPGSGNWYKPNGMFESRCMGRWPSSAINTIWGDALWAEAINAKLTYLEKDQLQIGCDPGYLLDSCAIHVRKGSVSLSHESHKGYDTSKTAGRLKLLCEQLGEQFEVNPKKIKVLVDSTGMGQGVIDQRGEYNFIGINSSSKAINQKRYPNRRSELWFTTRERVMNKNLDLSKLGDDELIELGSQLKAPIWGPDNQGKVVVEPKKETKKRLGRSPDDADAFNLAYANELDFGPPIVMGSRGSAMHDAIHTQKYDLTNKEEASQAAWEAQRRRRSRSLGWQR